MNEYAPYCSVDEASELIACCLAKNIPFYACRYPGEEDCRFGAQTVDVPRRAIDNGFCVVPFDMAGDTEAYTITPDTFARDIDTLQALPRREAVARQFSDSDIDCPAYLAEAQSLIECLREGELQKVVLSRTITHSCDTNNFLPQYFARLCRMYASAYIFIVNIPGVCGWVGATPEMLLQSHSAGYETMALAGTRPAGTTIPWGAKEQDEQQYVERYIADILHRAGLKDTTIDRYTRRAAQVEHLCTQFNIRSQHDVALRNALVAALHPTPAVAGTPTDMAIEAIRSTETHSRRYYGGYVGESLSDGRCALYVNLRSMEFTPSAVRLYVGGGLTAQSVAIDEWNETCAKSQTLLSAFQ